MVGGAAGTAAVIALAAAFIMPWEGLETRAYRDIVGIWTICYGETYAVKPGEVRTPAQCESGLAKGVGEYYARLDACVTNDNVPVKATAAFVSWSWNVGTGAACGSTLVRKLNAGDVRGACDELLRWIRAGGRVVQGLVNRRKAERTLCLEGVAEGR